ncbi:MAG: hypothetical protein ACI3ZA_06925 [Alloprevotella sp.]
MSFLSLYQGNKCDGLRPSTRHWCWLETAPAVPPRAVPAGGTIWRNLEARHKWLIFALAKEEERRLFLFSRFWGKLSYMSPKTILYDRKNYKQDSENYLLDSFYEALDNCSEVLFCEIFLKERFDFIKANFPFLNYL